MAVLFHESGLFGSLRLADCSVLDARNRSFTIHTIHVHTIHTILHAIHKNHTVHTIHTTQAY